MDKGAKILVVGHQDIIQKSLNEHLAQEKFRHTTTLVQAGIDVFDQTAVKDFFKREKFEYVFLASTHSGGIEANQKRAAEFIYSNLMSQCNIIDAAYRNGVKKLLLFSSSCVYPKFCPQPIREEYLMTGPMEPTSEAYATAKLAGIRMCQAYRRQYGFNAIVMIPTTVYGPGEDMDPATSHVLGALMAKFHQAVATGAKNVAVWGSGRPRREFLYKEDFARAAVFCMDRYEAEMIINAGIGEDVAIADLAKLMAKVTGFKGEIVFDSSKPDGAMQKLLDSCRFAQLGWTPSVLLSEGITRMYDWYQKIINNGVKR